MENKGGSSNVLLFVIGILCALQIVQTIVIVALLLKVVELGHRIDSNITNNGKAIIERLAN